MCDAIVCNWPVAKNRLVCDTLATHCDCLRLNATEMTMSNRVGACAFRMHPVAEYRHAPPSIAASRSVCCSQKFCRSASATHCSCQFLSVCWCGLGFSVFMCYVRVLAIIILFCITCIRNKCSLLVLQTT